MINRFLYKELNAQTRYNILDSLGFESKPVNEYNRPIYLDMQATSPTDPRVLDAMIPYMTELYGNPHSRTHKYGWETEQAVERAREVRSLCISTTT